MSVIPDAKLAALREGIVNAGIALAYSGKGAGIAGVWAENLRQHIRFCDGPDAVTQTWMVDGEAIHINATWTAGLKPSEVVFLIAHETLHIAFGHTDGPSNEMLNIAQDAVINQALVDDNVGTMPTGDKRGVLFSDFVGEGYTGPRDSMVLFEWLKARQKKQPQPKNGPPQQGQGQGQKALQGCSPKGLPGKGKAGGAKGADDLKIQAEKARATMREAAQQAGRGSAIAELLSPKPTRATIQQVIRRGFEQASQNARNRSLPSYSRAGRRSVDPNILTPGRIGTEARVAFVGDVSGSLGPEGVAILVGFIEQVSREFPDTRVYLVTHTDEVVFADWLRAGGDREKAKKASGFTGGTSFEPAYRKVKEVGTKFDVAIHFTDGFNSGPWPESPTRDLLVALFGSGHGMTAPPAGAKVVPVQSIG